MRRLSPSLASPKQRGHGHVTFWWHKGAWRDPGILLLWEFGANLRWRQNQQALTFQPDIVCSLAHFTCCKTEVSVYGYYENSTVQEIIKTCDSKRPPRTLSFCDELSCTHCQEGSVFPFNEISCSAHFVFFLWDSQMSFPKIFLKHQF